MSKFVIDAKKLGIIFVGLQAIVESYKDAWESGFDQRLMLLCTKCSDEMFLYYASYLFAALIMFVECGHVLMFGRIKDKRAAQMAIHKEFLHPTARGSFDGKHNQHDESLRLSMACVDFFRNKPGGVAVKVFCFIVFHRVDRHNKMQQQNSVLNVVDAISVSVDAISIEAGKKISQLFWKISSTRCVVGTKFKVEEIQMGANHLEVAVVFKAVAKTTHRLLTIQAYELVGEVPLTELFVNFAAKRFPKAPLDEAHAGIVKESEDFIAAEREELRKGQERIRQQDEQRAKDREIQKQKRVLAQKEVASRKSLQKQQKSAANPVVISAASKKRKVSSVESHTNNSSSASSSHLLGASVTEQQPPATVSAVTSSSSDVVDAPDFDFVGGEDGEEQEGDGNNSSDEQEETPNDHMFSGSPRRGSALNNPDASGSESDGEEEKVVMRSTTAHQKHANRSLQEKQTSDSKKAESKAGRDLIAARKRKEKEDAHRLRDNAPQVNPAAKKRVHSMGKEVAHAHLNSVATDVLVPDPDWSVAESAADANLRILSGKTIVDNLEVTVMSQIHKCNQTLSAVVVQTVISIMLQDQLLDKAIVYYIREMCLITKLRNGEVLVIKWNEYLRKVGEGLEADMVEIFQRVVKWQELRVTNAHSTMIVRQVGATKAALELLQDAHDESMAELSKSMATFSRAAKNSCRNIIQKLGRRICSESCVLFDMVSIEPLRKRSRKNAFASLLTNYNNATTSVVSANLDDNPELPLDLKALLELQRKSGHRHHEDGVKILDQVLCALKPNAIMPADDQAVEKLLRTADEATAAAAAKTSSSSSAVVVPAVAGTTLQAVGRNFLLPLLTFRLPLLMRMMSRSETR